MEAGQVQEASLTPLLKLLLLAAVKEEGFVCLALPRLAGKILGARQCAEDTFWLTLSGRVQGAGF